MHRIRILTLAIPATIAATTIAGATLLSSPVLAGPHDAGYYACNANNAALTKYYRWVKKRSDDQEKAFRTAVLAAAGAACRSVSYPNKAPTAGTEI